MATADQNKQAQAFIQTQIDHASKLLEAKKELLSQIGEVRDLLGTVAGQGLASTEQVAWIAENLPKRKRNGNGDDADADTTNEEN